MARFEPTSAQRSAIEESGRAVLVSAAAGSGKTGRMEGPRRNG